MSKTYTPALDLYDTQRAIGFIKQTFQRELSDRLSLSRVTAPLFVDPATGLNDDLNGVERPVTFDIPAIPSLPAAQVVHSLAKWKRMALGRYGFAPDTGLYTDMNAIRRDEALDALHSVYVDQWDWEKVITRDTRTVEQLQDTVRQIVEAVCDTLEAVKARYPALTVELSREVSFVTTQELEDRWPDLTPQQREDAWLKDHPTAFVMQIGGPLKSGQKHDGRAPDYDDWALNGDILFWNSTLGRAFEVSSMGIRVDAESMRRQCEQAGCPERLALPFHKGVLDGTLPLTMGGGIGQSRLCMLLLGKAHIGEVQASIWDSQTRRVCKAAGVALL